MSYQKVNGFHDQKNIKQILGKNGFWLQKRLSLKCVKPEYFNCEVATNSKIYVKRHKYKTYKASKQYNFLNCSKY